MSATLFTMHMYQSQHEDFIPPSAAESAPFDLFASRLDALLTDIRPRLLRAVRAWGIPADRAEDIVQETLLAAWQHLDHVRSPDRFDAWLISIAHNCCRMYFRRARSDQHELSLYTDMALSPVADREDTGNGDSVPELPDLEGQDPLQELERQDLVTLLDRALGHLSKETREVIELCYLVEVPQRTVARQLGLTLSALEARLYRARKQLRQVLASELRADAEDFGLSVQIQATAGWRETREWCHFCGRHRLHGLLEPLPDGTARLRLRCSACARRFDGNWADSGPTPHLAGYRSFGPAIKHFHAIASAYYKQALAGRATCQTCGTALHIYIRASDVMPWQMYPDLIYAILECPCCGPSWASAATIVSLTDAQVASFLRAHPRWIIEPDVLCTFRGHQAIRHRMSDPGSSAQITFFSDATDLRLLAVISE